MNKVDVVLIYPPTEFVDNLKQDLHNYRINNKKVGVWPPLGLLYLSAVLDKKNISSRVIDAFVLDLSLEQIIKEIARYSPKIVGISVTTLQIRNRNEFNFCFSFLPIPKKIFCCPFNLSTIYR